jgi:hypothetical protein
VGEDFPDDGLLQDGGGGLQPIAAVRAVLEVQFEDALEQPSLNLPHRPMVLPVRLSRGGPVWLSVLIRPLRHHQRTHLGVGRHHAVEAKFKGCKRPATLFPLGCPQWPAEYRGASRPLSYAGQFH